MSKPLKIITCCDNRGGIGLDNDLPWKISEEMKLFREKTIGCGNNCVIMGKNTFLSIPERFRPLRDRDNYVVTSSSPADIPTEMTLRNLDGDLDNLMKKTDYDVYWIIGGESIYHTIMDKWKHRIDEIHISIINADYKCNKNFPEIDSSIYKLIDTTVYSDDNFTHYVYKSTYQNRDCP